VHSGIHTVHSPTDARLLRLQFTLKLDGSYMFRSTTIIRELAIEALLSILLDDVCQTFFCTDTWNIFLVLKAMEVFQI